MTWDHGEDNTQFFKLHMAIMEQLISRPFKLKPARHYILKTIQVMIF